MNGDRGLHCAGPAVRIKLESGEESPKYEPELQLNNNTVPDMGVNGVVDGVKLLV